ncbi:hypothetical protein [Gynuella sp.]|uniref:hypothetical protein n=1 Tax=Gynuella sp. TaxID=2969146 RepID=UPI003D0F5D77
MSIESINRLFLWVVSGQIAGNSSNDQCLKSFSINLIPFVHINGPALSTFEAGIKESGKKAP